MKKMFPQIAVRMSPKLSNGVGRTPDAIQVTDVAQSNAQSSPRRADEQPLKVRALDGKNFKTGRTV